MTVLKSAFQTKNLGLPCTNIETFMGFMNTGPFLKSDFRNAEIFASHLQKCLNIRFNPHMRQIFRVFCALLCDAQTGIPFDAPQTHTFDPEITCDIFITEKLSRVQSELGRDEMPCWFHQPSTKQAHHSIKNCTKLPCHEIQSFCRSFFGDGLKPRCLKIN